MGYLAPSSKLFARVHVARGPGVHTDEASSALGDLQGELSRANWRELAEQSGDAAFEASAVHANPRGGDEEPARVIVAQRELFPIAFAVTGLWGPDPPNNLRPLPTQLGRRSLPLAHENPYDPRSSAPFFQRMQSLHGMLRDLARDATARYDANGAARDPRRRSWSVQLAKMLAAVQYVLAQQGKRAPTILAPHPFGLPESAWGILAAQGNKKLPFVAYSELPMATCPGAGQCGVRLDYYEQKDAGRDPRKGWCYSFKAFRYPAAFARMFLNTLASYADREFAIMRAGGPSDPGDYVGRVRAALSANALGPGVRVWPQYVKGQALAITREVRAGGAEVFMRLFVDGDLNYEDNIVAWMQAVAQMGAGAKGVGRGEGGVRVYGYSKCWQQLINVDAYLKGQWPTNYVVNLSSGSVYFSEKYAAIRTAVEQLPITRGYFEAVPLREYLPALAKQTELLRDDPGAVVPMPPEREQHFRFDAARIRAFVRLNGVRTLAEAQALLPDLRAPTDAAGRARKLDAGAVRHLAYDAYLRQLLADPTFGAIVRRELLRDREPASEHAFLAAFEDKQRARLERLAQGGRASRESRGFSDKALRDKALALALHETLWSFGLGGSCPLVCGSCSSSPPLSDTERGQGTKTIAVHRCASMTTFKGKVISIGIH